MKKIYIEEPTLDTYLELMNRVGDLHCEMKGGKPCSIEQIIIKRNPANGGAFYTLRLSTDEAQNAGEYFEDQVRIYRTEFEDGDYVCQQDGDIIICAGIDRDRYLFHAALEEETGDIHYPDSNSYHYGRVMTGDRLCTEKEMMEINGKLMKQGKIFDIVQKKVVDSIFKKNPELWEKFMKGWEKYRNDELIKLKGFWCDGPILAKRGELKSREKIQECINTYEARIKELTEMCNEVYEKLKQAKKS